MDYDPAEIAHLAIAHLAARVSQLETRLDAIENRRREFDDDDDITRVAKAIKRQLAREQPLSKGTIRRGINSRDRDQCTPALELLQTANEIEAIPTARTALFRLVERRE